MKHEATVLRLFIFQNPSVLITSGAAAHKAACTIRDHLHGGAWAAVLGTERNCPTQDSFRAPRSRIATCPL